MNKKGFTLVEILAVIVLLGVVGAISIVSINGVTSGINKSMLEKKIAIIEESAVLMGEDFKATVTNSRKKYSSDNYPCISIVVSELIPDYLDKDNENECLPNDSEVEEGCVINPADNDDYLDTKNVIIYFKNRRIHAILDMNDELSCT